MKLYEAEVFGRERFGEHILIRYRWEGEPPEPGQFVMARATIQDLNPFLSRPLFAHDYDKGVASLLFKVRGAGTALLAQESAGILVTAPGGRGYTFEEGDRPVALVGGGVWVSPLKLLSRRLTLSGVAHDVYLEVPATAPKAYAAWISENYPHANLVETNGSQQASCPILDCLGDLARYSAVYASGPTEMLDAVRIASAGKVSAQLALRERMACANGSCFGCAIPVWRSGARTYARVCTEGPVFPAEILAW